MLDNLLEIEVAYSLLKGGDAGDDPIDAHYKKLNTLMEVGFSIIINKDHSFFSRCFIHLRYIYLYLTKICKEEVDKLRAM